MQKGGSSHEIQGCFDVDFSQLFYLTDTGRCWDGYKVSVRDKIPVYQDQWTAFVVGRKD